MSDLTRREALGLMASLPLASTLELAPQALERASRAAERAVAGVPAAFTPSFFTPHEWETVRLLADRVIELQLAEACSKDTVRRVLKKTLSSPGSSRSGVFPR